MTNSEVYWFARGYHDGRLKHAMEHGHIRPDIAELKVHSVEDGVEAISRDDYDKAESGYIDYIDYIFERQAYKRGYDWGVRDYFELDAEENKA